jgi:enoyl-CoA hydratase
MAEAKVESAGTPVRTGLAKPTGPSDDKIYTWPHLVRAEFLCTLLVIGFMLVWSLLVDAPLEEPAAPTRTPNQFTTWDQIRKTKKPIIAAVSGFALGGGCEFVMTCDMVIASETAKFGQPEIKLGTIPGAGGTQRLTKAIGKAKAMELILTGRFLSAEEAHFYGLVNKVVPKEMYLYEAFQLAKEIAQHSPVAVQLAKESINRSFETHLDEGLTLERKNFYLTFSSEDQKEGMKAFMEKRKPEFKGK